MGTHFEGTEQERLALDSYIKLARGGGVSWFSH